MELRSGARLPQAPVFDPLAPLGSVEPSGPSLVAAGLQRDSFCVKHLQNFLQKQRRLSVYLAKTSLKF